MKEFTGGRGGKIVTLELVRGEELISSIETKLAEMGIKNAAVISAVGSLQRLNYHRPTTFAEAAEDEWFDLKVPLEICSLSGTVFDGVGHFHFSAAGQDGIVYTVH